MKKTEKITSLILALVMMATSFSGFTITAQAAMADEAEDYEMGTTFSGGFDTDKRYFKFTVSKKKYVSLTVGFKADKDNYARLDFDVYNTQGNIIIPDSDFLQKYNVSSGKWSGSSGKYLKAGTYYLQVSATYRYLGDTRPFSFRIQAEDPITLPKGKITSLKSKGRKITVKYKSASNAIGYKITYSTNSRFKKNVKTTYSSDLSKTLGKFKKGKRYYVKVCPYTVYDDGTYVYGQNSLPKTVKVK